MINQPAVEKVLNALVEATSHDPEKLQALMAVLVKDGPATGLGYIISDAVAVIAKKLSARSYV